MGWKEFQDHKYTELSRREFLKALYYASVPFVGLIAVIGLHLFAYFKNRKTEE